MPCLTKRDVQLILGKTGSGKTTLARQLVRGLNRCIILDNGFQEFTAPHFTDIAALHDYLDINAIAGEDFKAAFTPLKSQYETLFRWALEIGNEEAITLVLEECDRFPTPASADIFEEIVQRGRHYGVNLIALATFPFNVNIDLRRQATEICTFQQHEPADIKWLSAVMPGEAIDQVQQLGDYEFLRWTAKSGQIEKSKTVKGG